MDLTKNPSCSPLISSQRDMESDDDFQLLPQSEEISPSERKLKRLKKAIRVSTEPSLPLLDFPKSEAQDSEELKELSPSGAGSESESEEGFDGGNELDFGLGGEEEEKEEENGLGVKTKRVLEFDSVGDDFDAKRDDPSEEMGDGAEDLRIEEPVKKRRSSDELDENVDNKKTKTKKKKKKNVDESVVDLDATTKKMTKKVFLSLSLLGFVFVFVVINSCCYFYRKEGTILSNFVLSLRDSYEVLCLRPFILLNLFA